MRCNLLGLCVAAALSPSLGSAAVYTYIYAGNEMACLDSYTCETGGPTMEAFSATLAIDEDLLGGSLASASLSWSGAYPSTTQYPSWLLDFTTNYGGISSFHFLSYGNITTDENKQIVSWGMDFLTEFVPWDWSMSPGGDSIAMDRWGECIDSQPRRCLVYGAGPGEWSGPQLVHAPVPPALLPFMLALAGFGFLRRG